MKKCIVLMLTVLIICSSSVAFAEDYSASETSSTGVLGDIIFLKPMGAAALVVGSAAFLVSWPFAAISNSSDQTFQVLVREPYEYTFKRPVGDNSLDF